MVRKSKRQKKSKRRRRSIKGKLPPRVKELSPVDSLTGLHTYQYFTERLDLELKHAKRYIFPISLIMVDIDYFKSVNDIYGYHVGNTTLKQFAHYIKRFARATDVITRYRGAGCVILSLYTNKEGAFALAQRLCEQTQKHAFRIAGHRIKLKVSIGITNFPDDGFDSEAQLIDAAESAVRSAKERGGNRVCIYERLQVQKKDLPPQMDEDIEGLKVRLKKAGRKLDQALLDSIYAFAKIIEARDHYTGEHAEKMVNIVRSIAKQLGLQKKDIAYLEHAAVLHDLGKIGINDKILHKRGKLTKAEYKEIKKHPLIGAEIIRSVHFLKDVVPLIMYHHERYDGKGYAAHLKGSEIPLGARILAIADVYQALISDRPYRRAYSKKKAIKIIKEASGKQFDPKVVEALLKSLKK